MENRNVIKDKETSVFYTKIVAKYLAFLGCKFFTLL